MRENSRFGRQPNYSPSLLLNAEDASLPAVLPRSDERLLFFADEKQRKCARVASRPRRTQRPDPVSRFVLDLLSLLRRAYRLSLEVGQKNLRLEHLERGRKYTLLHFCIWGAVAQFVLPNYDLCTL